MSRNCAAIVLGAGSSTRLGSPKQLLDYHGDPLIRHAAKVALAAGCSPVIVVLGARADEIRHALDGLVNVETTWNARWEEGMGTSIRAGLNALGTRGDHAILTLCDQPLVSAAFLKGLISTRQPIAAAAYSGTAGVPARFARSTFDQLFALSPDQGCKGVILRNEALLVECPEAAFDVDTPADYASLRL